MSKFFTTYNTEYCPIRLLFLRLPCLIIQFDPNPKKAQKL
uniref:Uncharacterized protein n=1 Tax=Setaria italica TaxID=4555 RepID=K4ANF5_SETIT